jgi:hypothetical protein
MLLSNIFINLDNLCNFDNIFILSNYLYSIPNIICVDLEQIKIILVGGGCLILSTWAVVDACATFIKVVKYRIKKKKRA